MNDKIIKLAGKGATLVASSLYKDKLSDKEKKETVSKLQGKLKHDLVRDVTDCSDLIKNSFCNIKSNVQVVRNDVANEFKRTSSKATSTTAGTFSHDLASNYMSEYNNYYRNKTQHSLDSMNLARKLHR